MKTITETIRQQLRKPLPPEAIKQHPTKKFLSTIKAIYVIERLNDVFGIGGWSTTSTFVEKSEKMIVVKTILTIPEYNITLEAYGGNDNIDLGDAYKGAVTDGITKIGSYLEIGIDVFKGLATNFSEDIKPKINKSENKFLFELLIADINESKDLKTMEKTLNTIKENLKNLSQSEIDNLRDIYESKKLLIKENKNA